MFVFMERVSSDGFDSQSWRMHLWLWVRWGKMGARDREFRMDVHTLLYSKWITKKKKKKRITNKDLL